MPSLRGPGGLASGWPAKELPPKAFQCRDGACSCATPVACGRFILRPARRQIQASQKSRHPRFGEPWRGREGRGPFGGVTPGVTAQGADGGKWILMGLVAFVGALVNLPALRHPHEGICNLQGCT